MIWIGPGSENCEPTKAATTAASRYWPSTPMLKRFIRKPTATARPAMNSGTARLIMVVMLLTTALGVSPKFRNDAKASPGSAPAAMIATLEMAMASTMATTAPATVSSVR